MPTTQPRFAVPNACVQTKPGSPRVRNIAPRTAAEKQNERWQHMLHIIDNLNEHWSCVMRAAIHIHRHDPEAARITASSSSGNQTKKSCIGNEIGMAAPSGGRKAQRPSTAPRGRSSSKTMSTFAAKVDFYPPPAPRNTAAGTTTFSLERVPMEPLCIHIMHSLGLSQRDEPALGAVIASCLIQPADKEQIVDMKKLRELCREQRRPENWVARFQADGCVDERVQKATTGVVKNCNAHRKLYSGAPFGVTGDSDCIKTMQQQYLSGRNAKIEAALKKKAVFGTKVSFKEQESSGTCGGNQSPRHSTTTGYRIVPVPQHGKQSQPSTSASSGSSTRWWIHVNDFRRALLEIDRPSSGEDDIKHLISVMDPQHTHFLDVDLFVQRFGWELMKTKCNRNTVGPENNDGVTNTFEWRASLPSKSQKVLSTAAGMVHRKQASAAATSNSKQRAASAELEKVKPVIPGTQAAVFSLHGDDGTAAVSTFQRAQTAKKNKAVNQPENGADDVVYEEEDDNELGIDDGEDGEDLRLKQGASEYDRKAVLHAMVNRSRRLLGMTVKNTKSFSLRKKVGKFSRGVNDMRDKLLEEALEQMPEHPTYEEILAKQQASFRCQSQAWNQNTSAADPVESMRYLKAIVHDQHLPLKQRLNSSRKRMQNVHTSARMAQLAATGGTSSGINAADWSGTVVKGQSVGKKKPVQDAADSSVPQGAIVLGNHYRYADEDQPSVTAAHKPAPPPAAAPPPSSARRPTTSKNLRAQFRVVSPRIEPVPREISSSPRQASSSVPGYMAPRRPQSARVYSRK